MSQLVYQCYKFVPEKQKSKAFSLLCSTSASIVWVMAINNCVLAQQSSPGFQSSHSQSQGVLKVPSLPSTRYPVSASKQVPPPPKGKGIAVAPIASPFSNSLQLTSVDNIKQLENRFIEEMTTQSSSSSASTRPDSKQTGLPILAANKDKPLLSSTEVKLQNGQLFECIDGSNCQKQKSKIRVSQLQSQRQLQPDRNRSSQPTFNQLLYPDGLSDSEKLKDSQTQEFVAPRKSSPIPPLPPLPGENPLNTTVNSTPPTFNQLLNSRSSSVKGVPTFTQPKFNSPGNTKQLTTKPFSVNPANSNFSRIQPVPQKPIRERESNTTGQFRNQPQTPTNNPQTTQIRTEPLKEPSLKFEGVYLTQGDDTSARARLTGIYPLSPQALFGATLDLTSEDSSFDDSANEGLNINELYFATSLTGVPNLRFAVGQLDLTSYFDRNSFAKDGASQFFNPVFQTNPALAATGISSRTGLLVNWSVADNINAKAAVFSSSDKLSDFTLDGFAGEIGIRYGNAIIRGTYATSRDAGNRDTFPESFGIARGNGQFGPLEDDREEAYGVNAEVFIPKVKLGLFARYGRYENRDLEEGADTYVLGASFLDLFTPDDRLGLAYGRELSNDSLRNGDYPDVVELFYDFQFVPNLRLGFTIQGRDSFEETVLGVRVRSEFDITPKRRDSQ
ncbi:MAG: carbohydrate porin [Cyanobacteria bacterium P01_A01_bin.80]